MYSFTWSVMEVKEDRMASTPQKSREQHQQQTDPVHSHKVLNTKALDPGDLFDQLKPGYPYLELEQESQ